MILYLALLIFSVSIALLWWYFSTARVQCYVDQTRQRFFSLREKLFDKAMNGNLQFDSDAYGIMRSTLNGQIRFCEDLTFIRFLIIVFTYSRSENRELVNSYTTKLDKALAKVDSHQKEIYSEIRAEMHVIMMLHIVESSLFVKAIFVGFRLVHNFRESLDRLFNPPTMNKSLLFIDAEAELLDQALVC